MSSLIVPTPRAAVELRVERIKVLRDFYEPRQLALEYIRQLVGEGFEIVEETTDGHPEGIPAYRTILERERPV